jgi:hypothetical protein
MLALFHPFLSPLRDFLVHFKVSCRCGYISPLNTWKCISLTRIQYLHTIVWGGGRGVNFVLSGCINCSCLSMSFDKCMHLYNPKFHPNVERYCHPRKSPHALPGESLPALPCAASLAPTLLIFFPLSTSFACSATPCRWNQCSMCSFLYFLKDLSALKWSLGSLSISFHQLLFHRFRDN